MNEVLAETDLLGTTATNGITTSNGTMTCKERWTCSSCTETTMQLCSWLVAEQICTDNTAVKVQSRMMVTNGSSCPKFSVNNRVNVLNDNQIIMSTVTVDDWNMGGGFVNLLANSSVVCQSGKNTYKAKVDGNQISCSWESKLTSLYHTRCQQLVPHYNHLSIVFNGKFLRFDNVSNHYLTTYPGGGDCPKMECPHCHWNNGTHRFYCTMCSVENNTFADTIPYCDVRNISSLLYLETINIRNDERCSSKGPVVINYSVTPKINLQSKLFLNPGSGNSQVVNHSSPVHPTLDHGQVFGGIESGSTTFWVHGQHFSGLRNVKFCVKNRYWCGNCDVRNDTHMVCRTPKINIHPEDAFENEYYVLFFAEKSIGIKYNFSLPDLHYQRYHDPVFTDFVVDGCCNVTVNGLYLDKGFTAEDLSIILVGESSSSRCQITSLDSTQIICKVSQSSSSQLGTLPKQLNVTIGGNLNVIKLSKQKYIHFKSLLARILWPGVVTIGAFVSFIEVLWVALVFFKATKEYDLLHLHGDHQLAKMRPLDERNPNDYDENGKPENMWLVRDECH
ncbi:unnamed protein product [Macrosiphum euphorbiae]|uniref:Uncharacterized protein n=1 Tax=Macrosiphum euphorbiae TaxID=13131 RepID=A0AAV0Y8T5_9HEMI|nr:unnamed protein product [Macrosiphum euphorbiae]